MTLLDFNHMHACIAIASKNFRHNRHNNIEWSELLMLCNFSLSSSKPDVCAVTWLHACTDASLTWPDRFFPFYLWWRKNPPQRKTEKTTWDLKRLQVVWLRETTVYLFSYSYRSILVWPADRYFSFGGTEKLVNCISGFPSPQSEKIAVWPRETTTGTSLLRS